MKSHKPDCSSNIHCAVYHADGICPGYRGCDCGFESVSSKKATMIEKLDKQYFNQEVFLGNPGLILEVVDKINEIIDRLETQKETE
jgi:hypothetical protein